MTDYGAIAAAMGPETNGRDPLEVSGVTALSPGCDLGDVADVLRRWSALLPVDALDRRRDRDRAIDALKKARVSGAAGWVDAALSGSPNGQSSKSAPAPALDPSTLREQARPVLECADILQLVGAYVCTAGYAGDTRAPQLVYLALTSRLLDRPANLFISGPSAAGKNFAVRVVLSLFPPEAHHDVAGMSPLAVMYSEQSFAHRVVIVSEAAAFHEDGIGASLLRGLAWDAELKYDTVIDGKGVHLYKPGPTGLITTGTRDLEPELATRLWTVPVPDDPAHTRAVIRATAKGVAGAVIPSNPPDAFTAAQRWLAVAGAKIVIVPFAGLLADLVPVHEVRIRRDFTQLLTLVRTHALLHQHHRVLDAETRVVADLADYDAVLRIVGPVFEASLSAGLTKEVRATVEAVERLSAQPRSDAVSVTDVGKELGLSPAAAWYRVRRALAGRWLVNDETRKRQPAKLRIGEPLPRGAGLPDLHEIVETLKRTPEPWAAQAVARFNDRFNGASEAPETPDESDELAREVMREGEP